MAIPRQKARAPLAAPNEGSYASQERETLLQLAGCHNQGEKESTLTEESSWG